MKDAQIKKIIHDEELRQTGTINLIASENYVSRDVREALGSVFTNKYAEGYPHKRYYAGNKNADILEELVCTRARKLFRLSSTWGVNVQSYSGSPANFAVYQALVPKGEKIMSLDLAMGGHLTHGSLVSATSMYWQFVHYGLHAKTERLDYDEIRRRARKEQPRMIVAGFTAYSRMIDFKKFRAIADEVGALLFIDMSHIAGLVAGRVHTSPFPYAHVVMTTTHKTLRGPRSALIFARNDLMPKIQKTVFPGLQGGPHLNQIAAVGVALQEAMHPSFRLYAKQTVANAKRLAMELAQRGWRIVSGGTDTHLLLIDTQARGISGQKACDMLEAGGIVVNKNTIPFDARKPMDPSGIRVGTAAVTTRGMGTREIQMIAGLIDETLLGVSPKKIQKDIKRLVMRFPVL